MTSGASHTFVSQHEPVAVGVAGVGGTVANDAARDQRCPHNAVHAVEQHSREDVEPVEVADPDGRGRRPRTAAMNRTGHYRTPSAHLAPPETGRLYTC